MALSSRSFSLERAEQGTIENASLWHEVRFDLIERHARAGSL
jgi:hypothetical protein